jgi:hypothetical protein
MVIYRLAPGELAPWSGGYRLVGDFGESLNRAVRVDRGARLPLVEVEDESEVWYVLEDEFCYARGAA